MKALVLAGKALCGPGTLPGFWAAINRSNGAIEGDRYVVSWGLGHLVELADPEAL